MSQPGEDRVQKLIPWALVAGFAVLSVTLGMQEYYPSVAPASKSMPVTDSTAVELAVVQEGDLLALRWNPQSAVVSTATHGLLSVVDGVYERRIGLDSQDLRTGTARYAPLSRNVSFQLSVYTGMASGKGSVLFLARGGDDQRKGFAPSEPEIAPDSFPSVRKHVSTPVRDRTEDEEDEPRKPPVAIRPIEKPTATPLPAVTADASREAVISTPAMPVVTPVPVSVPQSPAPPPPYRVVVTAEPSRGTRIEQVLGKVPFVRRIAKSPSPSELVKPVRRIEPQLAGTPVTSPMEASVEIQVDRTGKVKSAKLVDLDHAPGNVEWASLHAAEGWKFESPKDGQSSWLVLRFYFEPLKAVRTE